MVKSKKMYYRSAILIASVLVVLKLTACDQSSKIEELEKYDVEMRSQMQSSTEDGRVLTEVAGKAVAPVTQQKIGSNHLDQAAQPYAGRYHVSVSCEDPIVKCNGGSADFILNLLPDGTAHRTIIHLGTITFESHQQYRQDRWIYHPEMNQIILQRANGVEFLYTVNGVNSIVMDRRKIRDYSPKNIEYFAQGGAYPLHDYVLKRKVD